MDYYPFGMLMPGREYTSTEYRFGLNTQEKETELGSSITSAEFWVYDGKLGRRFNVDPKNDVSLSTYSAFNNRPILIVDIKGDTGWFYYQLETENSPSWHYHTTETVSIQTGWNDDQTPKYETITGRPVVVTVQGNLNEPQAVTANITDLAAQANFATITIYSKDGTTSSYTGLTMTSDDAEYTSIDEGIYTLQRESLHTNRSGSINFRYRVLNQDGTDGLRTRDGVPNANPGAGANRGLPIKTEIYLHNTVGNTLGTGTSTGCLLTNQFEDLHNTLKNSLAVGESAYMVLSRTGAVGNPVLTYPVQETTPPPPPPTPIPNPGQVYQQDRLGSNGAINAARAATQGAKPKKK